ncbi:MAG TPA: chalcone isomerase family protein [Quisquiliibacterium sp.]|nr:chalcone isomerase family protein [Quisquiliibacterium sp.]HPA88659.1 chalcone isomerase family protein [Quisquiliibacterium sp.]HQD82820.1 chalcone isomerase family protein [Quisquiliibacterium sp.]HQN11211.1 chalcone isomerase family protein [Quisquiliibacterium sp.]HQP67995.1 chalcone isomerase family protein [Quisquiliibacterium sp.]
MNIRAVAAGCALAIAGAASPVGTACATGVAAPAASGVTAITASPMTASAAAASGTTATDPAVTQAPAAVRAALAQARLQGQGVLRWFGLKIYEARLWTGGESLDPARYEQAAFALDLRYARALDGAAIAQASHKEITRLGFGSAEQRAAWLDAMHRIFPDVTDGDRITGVHHPERGVAFYRNDVPIGRIDAPGFGRAFFAIWLDRRTVAPDVRNALLGLAGAPR